MRAGRSESQPIVFLLTNPAVPYTNRAICFLPVNRRMGIWSCFRRKANDFFPAGLAPCRMYPEFPCKISRVRGGLHRFSISKPHRLACHSVSNLSRANSTLKTMLEKDPVRIGGFRKSPCCRLDFVYPLTPKGIDVKSRGVECNDLRDRLTEKPVPVQARSLGKVCFVGPEVMKDSSQGVIRNRRLKILPSG